MARDGENNKLPPRLVIKPPLLNSANPWATTLEQLRALYRCASTGAVTTRTALPGRGFPHDDDVHRFAFFGAGTHRVAAEGGRGGGDADSTPPDASLNTLGYSPVPLERYLQFIRQIITEEGEEEEEEKEKGGERRTKTRKPFIVSVTGSPDEVAECYRLVAEFVKAGAGTTTTPAPAPTLALEINLSCPNIPGKPPPAYDGEALRDYVRRVAAVAKEMETETRDEDGDGVRIPWGLKTPPYTHAGQFKMFVAALRSHTSSASPSEPCPVSFITATNTLGSCLLLLPPSPSADNDDDEKKKTAPTPALPGPSSGIGGLAGAPLHPLALGNVATLRRLLDAAPTTRHVAVLGVGGVGDAAAYRRMRSVGAAAVGVGTALGVAGVRVFADIEDGLGGVWEE